MAKGFNLIDNTRFRQFYLTYPISMVAPHLFQETKNKQTSISASASQQLET